MTQDEQQGDKDTSRVPEWRCRERWASTRKRESENPTKAVQIAAAVEQPSQSAKCHRKQLAVAEMRACRSDWVGWLSGPLPGRQAGSQPASQPG